ncbi:MAG: glycerophosphodiester phosphodiesterase [Oscillospiraceae bacterium]|nr:glycerophosphodiester phosphodiesterase [Oscillospiraceae bacterium]
MLEIEKLKGRLFAHRGLHDIDKGIPENSMLAFEKAVKKGTDIELDLHLLKDGNVVVFHDDDLRRMTGVKRVLKKCTYDEIKNLKLLATNETIPLLKDVLELVSGKVLLDVEFKYDIPAGDLESKACEYLDNYKGEFIVKSFNPYSVNWFRKNRPSFLRGQLSSNFKGEKLNFLKKFVMKNMLLNFITKPDFIAYGLKALPNKRVEKYRRKGTPILVWTITSNEELEEAKKYGDSYIFENI